MSEEKFDSADAEAMGRVQSGLVRAILPFQATVPTWLIALALARVLRVIIRKAPKQRQRELLPQITGYLEGRTTQPGAGEGLIWTPDRAN